MYKGIVILKEALKTINFLTENGVADYNELETRAETTGQRFQNVDRILGIEEAVRKKQQDKNRETEV